MKVLHLGPKDTPVLNWLQMHAGELVTTDQPINRAIIETHNPRLTVSYGYRHIIKPDVIAASNGRIVNLHISYLPWNRGADPNLWSIVDNTPKGVTIHHIDEGIDTGDIVAQRLVTLAPDDTLRSSYQKLQLEIAQLFAQCWPILISDRIPRTPQQGAGSYHKTADKASLRHLLSDDGWDTPIARLQRQRPPH